MKSANDHDGKASNYSSDFNERGSSNDDIDDQPELLSSIHELLTVFGSKMVLLDK